jgi:hypothetical protein
MLRKGPGWRFDTSITALTPLDPLVRNAIVVASISVSTPSSVRNDSSSSFWPSSQSVKKARNIRIGENPIALRPFNSTVIINANAKVNPTIEASKRPVIIRVAGAPKISITARTVKLGSKSAKTSLSAKLLLDIEKIARALGGMTAKRLAITAKSGNKNRGSTRDTIAATTKTITIVVSENRERAKQRRR